MSRPAIRRCTEPRQFIPFLLFQLERAANQFQTNLKRRVAVAVGRNLKLATGQSNRDSVRETHELPCVSAGMGRWVVTLKQRIRPFAFYLYYCGCEPVRP